MGLRFVIGRAGTGKTRYCLDSLIEELKERPDGPALILLVPEQASFQTDRALLDTEGIQAFFRAQVLSFRRLAYRVLLETGGLCLPSLTPCGKQMILRALVSENFDALQIFGRLADRPGFVKSLGTVLTELHQFGLDPASLQSILEKDLPESPLRRKLNDVSVIMTALDEAAENRFTDPDHFSDLVLPKIGKCNLIQNAHIWVDGFSGFTPQEYAVLETLMKAAETVEIALCLDGRTGTDQQKNFTPYDGYGPFLQTEETYRNLLKIASSAQVPIEQVHVLDSDDSPPPRFIDSPDLAHLEREFFSLQISPYDSEVQNIRLVESDSPRQEVETLAREIRSLCSSGKMRYRDIGVIVRSLDEYASYIEAIFAEHGIPAFIDRRRSVAHHPLVELIRSAVNVVKTNWSPEPVFQYLKTDLVGTINREPDGAHLWEMTEQVKPIPRTRIDQLENYVLAHGIRGRRWLQDEPWDFSREMFKAADEVEGARPESARACAEAEQLAEINMWRYRSTEALKAFHSQMSDLTNDDGSITVREFATCIVTLIDTLKVQETLERWAKDMETTVEDRDDCAPDSADPREAASEHRQVGKAVIDVLDDLVDILGQQAYSLEDIAEVLEVGLADLDLGLTPPKVDQVLVGSVERSRQPDLKAAFVLGLNEGQFPRVMTQDSIFSDEDREALKMMGVALKPGTIEQLQNENYLAYIAFTRAKQFLHLSYLVADEEGKRRSPSHFVKRLRRCFPGLEPVSPDIEPSELSTVATPLQLMDALCRNLRRGTDRLWVDTYDAVVQDDKLGNLSRKALRSLAYENQASLSPSIVEKALGTHLATSVSRLESFASCPFQHYGRYLLQLKERDYYELTPMDLGSFYHEALNDFVQSVKDLKNLDSEMISKELKEVLTRLTDRFRHDILSSTARNEFVAGVAERDLNDMLIAQVQSFKVSQFLPCQTEVSFGIAQKPGIVIELSKDRQLIIRGRIDRVDVAEVNGQKVARVIDYKLKAKKRLDLGEVVLGIRLQLLTYLLAIRKLSSRLLDQEVEVAGGLYMPIQAPITMNDDPDSVPKPGDDEFYAPYKARGLFSDKYAESMEQLEPMCSGNFVSLSKKKDGNYGKMSQTDVVPEDALLTLIDLVEKRIIDLAERVLDGEIEVRPYRIGAVRPCQFCELTTLCRFDPAIQYYRSESKLKKDDVLEMLRTLGEENNG